MESVRYEAPSVQTVPVIELRGVSKQFLKPTGELHTVLQNINLRIEKGQFVSLVGPTGCGKSTTLNLVAGFEQPTAGSVLSLRSAGTTWRLK
ncbi:ATP-binding cassette domain-containing protein [Alicyclobacillus macrosporangiidus]|uniref:NitT/TauT family transport system ATP-binding protein n=1 Tax=Alicyclobacillus macrosporangiidus TaxID=392015 RepID=A0A1I7GYN4_9BACL|nr:ATP-binding cassette domain-containing protein [Alicyclobacillus macrosporangiidus]SFU53376.1 NitT/TauT family transport system ATP-binding protein [Alicyclobacillus macrosporangiidus]